MNFDRGCISLASIKRSRGIPIEELEGEILEEGFGLKDIDFSHLSHFKSKKLTSDGAMEEEGSANKKSSNQLETVNLFPNKKSLFGYGGGAFEKRDFSSYTSQHSIAQDNYLYKNTELTNKNEIIRDNNMFFNLEKPLKRVKSNSRNSGFS